MRFTTLVPALEEQLSGSGMLDLGTVPELKANLARVLSVAIELRQADRISRIRSLQERLNTIEGEAIIRYVLCTKKESNPNSKNSFYFLTTVVVQLWSCSE